MRKAEWITLTDSVEQERVLRAGGQYLDLLNLYRSRAQHAASQEERKTWLLETASVLAGHLNNVDAAIDVYTAILDQDPHDEEAKTGLADILMEQDRWDELAPLLEERERAPAVAAEPVVLVPKPTAPAPAPGPSESAAFLDAYRAFKDNPDSEDVRRELERLALESGSVEELALAYDEAFEATHDSKTSLALVRSLARLKAATPDEHTGAIALWHRVLANQPDDTEALKALEGLYRERGDWSELADILETRLVAISDRDRRRALLTELRLVYAGRLGEAGLAFGAASRAYREHPEDDALARDLERMAKAQGKQEELCGLYLDIADRLGGRWELKALRALEQLHRDRWEYPQLATVLRRMALMEKDPELKKDVLYDLATILEEKLSNVDQAIDTYLGILAEDPRELTARKLLNRLCMAAGKFDVLLQPRKHRTG